MQRIQCATDEGQPLSGKAPEIRLCNLSVGHDRNPILQGLDMVLPSGRISALLGASGCGKSTLLKIILGLMVPLDGRVLLDGRCLTCLNPMELREARRRMGVLFQDGALLGSMSLGENVALPLREHTDLPLDAVEAVVRSKLRMVGLEPFIDYYPNQLSGGMRKRAGLARAMALDPGAILCDEPTAGLDPITAAELDRLILGLRDDFGMTIVVVTHDLETVAAVADHVVLLYDGGIAFQGDRTAFKSCEHNYIQRFLTRSSRPEVGQLGEAV